MGPIKRIIFTMAYILLHPKEVYRMVYSGKIQNKGLYEQLVKKANDLNGVGLETQTDKAIAVVDDSIIRKGNDYLRWYELFLNELRHKNITLLEFGCQGGNSLKLWENWFDSVTVIGVDLDEKCKLYETKNTHVVVGNSISQETYAQVKASSNSYTVIIDDASHAWGEQRCVLERYWELLEWGGYFIVEDLGCGCYGAYADCGYVPELIDGVPFFDYILNLTHVLRWNDNELKRRHLESIAGYSKQYLQIANTLEMIMYIPGAVILKKREKG